VQIDGATVTSISVLASIEDTVNETHGSFVIGPFSVTNFDHHFYGLSPEEVLTLAEDMAASAWSVMSTKYDVGATCTFTRVFEADKAEAV